MVQTRRRVTYSVGLFVVKAVDAVSPRQNIISSLTVALNDWVVEWSCTLEKKKLIYRRKIYLQIHLRLVGLKDPRLAR